MALGLTPYQIIEKGTHPQLVIADEWERVELKKIASVQNGYAFSSKLFNRTEGMPLIRIRDIFSVQTENLYLGEYKEDFVVDKGDILIGMDGDFKVSKWPGDKGLLNQRVCRIHFDSEYYEKEFLFICIQPYLNAIHSETSAVTVKHLSSRTINDIPFPLPPLPEQRAIVAKIEELFSDLDKGTADLKKAQDQLKVYRQAVLKKAFEGELTKEWREQQTNLPTADELLEQIKKERQKHYEQQLENWKQAVKSWEENGKEGKKPGKPKEPKYFEDLTSDELKDFKVSGGFYTKMGNLSDVVRGGSPRPAGDERFYNGSIPFLKVADLTRKEGMYVDTYTYSIKEAGLQKTRMLDIGTLVISNSGATLGVPKITAIKATANDGIAAFLGLTESRSIFLYHYWNSKTLALRAIDQGAGQPNLNTDLLKAYPVPVFSDVEQTEIIKEVQSRLSVCDKIEESITKSLEKAKALRQSILKKAFEGRLLSNEEIEKCKAAPDYEPASVLLEKIKAEKKKK